MAPLLPSIHSILPPEFFNPRPNQVPNPIPNPNPSLTVVTGNNVQLNLILPVPFQVSTQPTPEPLQGRVSANKRRRGTSQKVCHECGVNDTPEWRKGEKGVTLCNAHGIAWGRKKRKEQYEKEKTAASALSNFETLQK